MTNASGPRGAALLWTRRELRSRCWSLLGLGLLTGLAAAVSLAAFAGARRTDTSFERLRSETDASDAVIFASQVDIYAPDWTEVAELPYVETAGSFGLPFLTIVDGPEGVDLSKLGMFSVPFGTWQTNVDRPVVVKGRLPDPDNPHEVLAPPEALDAGMDVGQEYVIQRPSDDQIANQDFFGEPKGERITVEVVGIGRSAFELAIIPSDGAGFIATPAFHEAYGSDVTFIDNLLVRFKPGEGSISQLERDAREIFDSPTLPVLDAAAVSKRVTNGTSLETNGLALFALAVALAGSVLVGQALTRSVRAGSEDLTSMRALGLTRANAAATMALPHLLVISVAAVVAFTGAAALSPRFPIGLGRRVDPDVGFHIDWAVFVGGITLMTAVLITTMSVAAWREAGRAVRNDRGRGSRLVDFLTNRGAPPTVTTGARLALEPGKDRRALPTRPALVGVVVGVLGVVGAQTLAAGIDDAIANPARFGAAWDVEIENVDVQGVETFEQAMDLADATPDVVASAVSGRALIVVDDVTQPTYSIAPRVGRLDYATLDGRRPSAPGEVALGPETADFYDAAVGDTVTALDADGSPHDLLVVGIALLPTTPHSSYDQGAWVTPDQLERLAGAPVGMLPPGADEFASPPLVPQQLLAVEPGADPGEVAEMINGQLDPTRHGAAPTARPIDIANLRNVRSLPALFAAFTMLLAIGTVAHVCASVVRRRGADLAVLRAVGMTPRGTRLAVSWQATTLAFVGLVIGLPLGVVVGRTIWRLVAQSTPMLYVPPLSELALVMAVPVALIAANVLALWPGRRAARIRPAELLRTE